MLLRSGWTPNEIITVAGLLKIMKRTEAKAWEGIK